MFMVFGVCLCVCFLSMLTATFGYLLTLDEWPDWFLAIGFGSGVFAVVAGVAALIIGA